MRKPTLPVGNCVTFHSTRTFHTTDVSGSYVRDNEGGDYAEDVYGTITLAAIHPWLRA